MSSIIATPIDFSATPLAVNYASFFAVILDNVFTESECADLIRHANSHGDSWSAAGINLEADQAVSKGFRDSDRILLDDDATATEIWNRVIPHLPEGLLEIKEGGEYEDVVGKANMKWSKARGETGYWKARQLNPRLRFLRYRPGQFFKPHCDGLNALEKDNGVVLKSFVTLHTYLNDESTAEGLEGGATRFWTPNKKAWIDVEPKIGRVLVFQQRMLVHSGEPVVGGVKYTIRTELMYEKIVVGR